MAQQQTHAEPRGLGGWLILLALNIVLLLSAYAYLASWILPLIRFELARAKTTGATMWPFLHYGPDLLIGVLLPSAVLVLFALRHRLFPAACVTFFSALIALLIFDNVLFAVVNWEALTRSPQPLAGFRQVPVALIFDVSLLAIWGSYLRRSDRVTNTFVK